MQVERGPFTTKDAKDAEAAHAIAGSSRDERIELTHQRPEHSQTPAQTPLIQLTRPSE